MGHYVVLLYAAPLTVSILLSFFVFTSGHYKILGDLLHVRCTFSLHCSLIAVPKLHQPYGRKSRRKFHTAVRPSVYPYVYVSVHF